MKVMVIGGGGREAALVWSLQRSPSVKEILALPGNAGLAGQARCLNVAADDIEGLVETAIVEQPDLVIIGPELPLTFGLGDRLARENIPAFGPTAAAARLEGSKAFAKDFMRRHRIPTADYRVCQKLDEALQALESFGTPVVIKANGLAAGKGVLVARQRADAAAFLRQTMGERIFGHAGEKVVIEECLEGEEASVLAFCDGQNIIPMLPAQDHKRVNDLDQGPNTGGMGAYAPAPVVTPEMMERIRREVLEPTVAGMAAEGAPYQGVLYAGLMITAQGPKVIEFNCRFGDPEAQAVLPLLKSDLAAVALACVREELKPELLAWEDGAAVCVVMASGGYPGPFRAGFPITGIEAAEQLPGVKVWHAGTASKKGQWVTAGGRVLNIVATAPNLAAAVKQVYAAADKIKFEGAHYRRDIAARALKRAPR